MAQHLHLIMPLVAATRSVKFRRARFWCGCNPPARGRLRAWAPFPWGQLRVPSGDPGKCESATEQRRQSKAPLPLPRAVPAPNSWGLRLTLFAEMWSRFVWGRGCGRRWAHLDRLGKGGRAGSNLSRIRKLVGRDGWRARMHLGSARRPVHTDAPRTTQAGVEIEERTTLRLMPRVSLARCLRNRDAT